MPIHWSPTDELLQRGQLSEDLFSLPTVPNEPLHRVPTKQDASAPNEPLRRVPTDPVIHVPNGPFRHAPTNPVVHASREPLHRVPTEPVIYMSSAGTSQSQANVLQHADSVQSVANYLLSLENSFSSVTAASDKPKVNRTLSFIAETDEGFLTYSDGSSSSDDSYPNSQGTFSDCDDELMDDLEYFAEELDAIRADDALDIPLMIYLKGCGLPYFMNENQESLEELKHLRYALPWPACSSLRRQPGTRNLRQVKPNWRWPEISNVVRNYLRQFNDVKIQNENNVLIENASHLALPHLDFVTYGNEDYKLLINVADNNQLLHVMKHYILSTVSEAIRLLQNLPRGVPLVETLKFIDVSRVWGPPGAKWNVFTLPSDVLDVYPITIIFLAPWDFGIEDFNDFTAEQTFPYGSLDTLDRKDKLTSHTLWALIHDILQGKGHSFVVTNYLRWSFGTLTPDCSSAKMSAIFEAEIINFEGQSFNVPYMGVNCLEILIYWIQAARGMLSEQFFLPLD